MATNNFIIQNGFPLFASGRFEDNYALLETCEQKISEFNRTLEFYEIKLESGYYSGVQIVIQKQPDIELSGRYTPTQWGYERADEYKCYGVNCEFKYCYSEQKRREASEIRKIERFCRKYLRDNFGFEEYYVSARFSNGETWYEKIPSAKNTRAALLYAVS